MKNNMSFSRILPTQLSVKRIVTLWLFAAIGITAPHYAKSQVTNPAPAAAPAAAPAPKPGPNDTVKTVVQTPEQKAELSYNKGIADYAKGDYTTAAADFTDALTNKPDFEQAYLNRGNTKLKLKDNQGALTDFNKAIILSSSDDKAYFGIGQAQT
ncbi:MAG: hypothetical protein HKL88_00795, partial [Bacteroidia bacterium]|nr:hypothetical protein [Bacteroidia bacterium]